MGAVTDASRHDREELERNAVADLNDASERLVGWVELIRDPRAPWAFKWAPNAVRARIAARSALAAVIAAGRVLPREGAARRPGTASPERRGSAASAAPRTS